MIFEHTARVAGWYGVLANRYAALEDQEDFFSKQSVSLMLVCRYWKACRSPHGYPPRVLTGRPTNTHTALENTCSIETSLWHVLG
jgi:hypothetical protein